MNWESRTYSSLADDKGFGKSHERRNGADGKALIEHRSGVAPKSGFDCRREVNLEEQQHLIIYEIR